MCSVCNGYPGCPVCSPTPRYMTCSECNGTGYIWDMYDINENECINVTEEVFNSLPTEEDAYKRGLRYCKGIKDRCPTCGGIGDIEQEEDDDYNEWDDFYM